MNSSFHIIINEIRNKYAGKQVSLLDIFEIEKAYNICSIVNIRNDNCAFLRITSYGLDEIVFEDIVTNLDIVKKHITLYSDLDFEIKKILYDEAYGVLLEKGNDKFLKDFHHKPDINFNTYKEEIARLKRKCEELEKENSKLKGTEQQSLFDLIDN